MALRCEFISKVFLPNCILSKTEKKTQIKLLECKIKVDKSGQFD